jgi:hypothetical protein
MTLPQENRPPLDQRVLDRLVDGELTATQRRDLLLRLEAEPDGWRRCALAFLEAQCWREAFGEGRQSAASEIAPGSRTTLLDSKRSSRASVRREVPSRSLVAVAASLLAFGLGLAAGAVGRNTPAHSGSGAVAPESRRPGDDRGTAAVASNVGPEDQTPWTGMDPALPSDWSEGQPSSLPKYVRQRWERQGYQVVQERRIAPMALKDGSLVAVPVDEVKVHYVGHHAY